LDKIIITLSKSVNTKKIKNNEFIDLQEFLGQKLEKRERKSGRKLVIIIEEFSNIKIYDKIVIEGQNQLYYVPDIEYDIEYIIKQGAQITYLYDPLVSSEQISNTQEKRVFSRRFTLEKSSKLTGVLWLTDVNNIHTNIDIFLEGKKARANINGVYIAGKEQCVSLMTKQEHKAQETQSSMIINGICTDNSRVNYLAKLFVAKNAFGAKLVQKNKTIVFGNKVIVHSCPEMEVLQNNVTCAHGCAVGKFDKAELFYLMSRGLNDVQAKKFLIKGFFDFLLHLFENQTLQNILSERIELKMRQVL